MKGLDTWLMQQGLSIQKDQNVSGGCVAVSRRLTLSNGQQIFVKSMDKPATGLFRAEAAGLKALGECTDISVPEVIYTGEDCLILDYIETGERSGDFEQLLGQQLASLHQMSVPSFGFTLNTFCGSTEQPNLSTSDGYAFYAEHRFGYLARQCFEQQLIGKETLRGIESICNRLQELIPQQEPALLHGDLWAGNVMSDRRGLPVLIDPAVYWGWPEADLAMTQLFGGFSGALYQAYQEISPLESGWRERFQIYNLWHLLNHLYLFGESYRADVMAVVAKYR